ncbi:MAG TPA: molybdopterin converting factor subunit 1 [Firmicutes bacterium]|nr:molybdopterin converting factor subunit 1 [Bacillota bacterium]
MVKILWFAHLSEAVGKRELEIEVAGMTVAALKKQLQEQYPDLVLEHVLTAVNEEYVADDMVLDNGDVVAFIPPVSGG